MTSREEATLVLTDVGVNTPSWESARVSARLERGQLLLITGPVGSGKSLLAEALANVTRPEVTLVGTVQFGLEASSAKPRSRAFAPEDARLAVLPTDTVGTTLLHAVRRGGAPGSALRSAATRHLLAVGLADVGRVWQLQFRELSTAERRRATLALALAERPELLIVDGPLSSLDDRGRSTVLRALGEYLALGGRAIAFDRTPEPLVGIATVHAPLGGIRRNSSRPQPNSSWPPPESERGAGARPPVAPLLELSRVGTVRGRQGWLRRARRALALDGATLGVGRGEVVAVVGDNGSGKTSLLELTAGLLPVAFGEVALDGQDLTRTSERRSRRARRQMQIVHQEAATALGPHKTVRELLEESVLRVPSKTERSADRVSAWLPKVGLPVTLLERPADQLSLGEAQRVELARSLAARPTLLLLDTPCITGLSDQEGEPARLRSLLDALRTSGAGVLLAESSVARVRTLADRVAILLSGRIVELGAPEDVITQPLHPYTAVFVKRSLEADARSHPSNPPPSSSGTSLPPPSGDSLLDRHRRRLRLALEGAAPDPRSPSRGCPYVGHCPKEIDRCSTEEPPLAEALPFSGHLVACWRPL